MGDLLDFPAGNYEAAQELVIRLLDEGSVEFGIHVLIHAEDENFNELDVAHVLRRGEIYEHEHMENEIICYRFNGCCVDDGPMRAVVEITGMLVIVTAYRTNL